MSTDCYELLASPSTRSRDSPLIQRPPQQLKPAVLLSLTPLLLSLGNTLVHCRASLRPSNQQRCSIDCSVSYTPHVEASSLLLPSETHLAQQVSDALEETILLESYSKNAVSLQLLFLRADGGLLSAAILAASLVIITSHFPTL